MVNGKAIDPKNIRVGKDHNGIRVLTADSEIEITHSSWLCVKCYQTLPTGNVAFAHTAPFYFNRQVQSVTPRKNEVEYLIQRVSNEMERSRELLDETQINEFESALKFYREKLKIAE